MWSSSLNSSMGRVGEWRAEGSEAMTQACGEEEEEKEVGERRRVAMRDVVGTWRCSGTYKGMHVRVCFHVHVYAYVCIFVSRVDEHAHCKARNSE